LSREKIVLVDILIYLFLVGVSVFLQLLALRGGPKSIEEVIMAAVEPLEALCRGRSTNKNENERAGGSD